MANSPQTYPRRIPYGMVAAYDWTHADARDTSWNGNDGTLVGGASASGGEITLDGSTGYVNCGNSPKFNLTTSASFSAWIYQDVAALDYAIVSKYESTGDQRLYLFGVDTAKIRFAGSSNGQASTFFSYDSTVGSPINTWTHVAAVYDGGSNSVKLFSNGVEVSGSVTNGSIPSSLPVSSNIVTLGASQSGDGGFFSGKFGGSVRVYNRALSAQEISDIYRNERPLYIPSATATGLEAWYRYYGNANDVTGNGNDGTLNGDAAASSGVLTLDGTGDYITMGDVLDSVFTGTSAKFTIAAWIKLDALGNHAILAKNADSSFSENQRQFFFRENSGKIEFFWFGGLIFTSSYRAYKGATTLSTSSWYHVVATYDATRSRELRGDIFINGVDDAASLSFSNGGSPDSIQNGTAPLAIGAMVNIAENNSVLDLDGQIGSTRIYNRVLSATEISDIYNNERGDYA